MADAIQKPDPLSLPTIINNNCQHLYPESTTLFPHIPHETVKAIARFEFPQEQLGTLVRVKHSAMIRRKGRVGVDATPYAYRNSIIEQVPDVLTFVEAWATFTSILQNERPDLPISPALNGYMCIIVTLSRTSEWQNVLKYHLAFFSLRTCDPFFNSLLWISADPALLAMHCPPNGLLRLNDDCLKHIIEVLYNSGDQKLFQDLKNLSRCCSRLRLLSLPFIFEVMSWPLSGSCTTTSESQIPMIPDGLLCHIRRFYLRANIHTSKFVGALRSVIPKMSRISFCRIQTEVSPPDVIIQTLARSFTLTDIVFVDTPLVLHPALSLRFHRLESITIPVRDFSLSHTWYRDTEPEPEPETVNSVSRMLIDNQETLRRIDVPARFISFRDISTASWPLLESLALTDYSPPVTRYSDTTSIPTLVQGMPRLKDLYVFPFSRSCLQYAYHHSAKQHPPPNLSSSTERIESPLQDIVFSNIDFNNNTLLRALPSSLTSLTLLSECDTSNHQWMEETGLTLEHASRALAAISVLKYDGIDETYFEDVPVLDDLYILLYEQPSVALVREVTSYFPKLKRLQLGITHFGRPGDDPGTQEEYKNIWARYANALSGFTRLEELYLGLPGYIAAPGSTYKPNLEEFVMTMVEHIPTLKFAGSQCFRMYDETGAYAEDLYWYERRIERAADGKPSLHEIFSLYENKACWVGRCL